MIIAIPTYGRPSKQATWDGLPKALRENTVLVVQEREAHRYGKYPIRVLPSEIQTIGPTRQWILENMNDTKIVQVDDDFTICCRDAGSVKLHQATDQEKLDLFERIDSALDEYSHVGVSARQGNNRVEEEEKEVARMTGFTAVNTKLIPEGVKYDRMEVQEDLDFTLQLLREGHKNLVLYRWCYNQPGSNTSGGCSSFRTMEVQARSARRLAELHPGFVKVVEKETKTSWNGQKRTDVTVYWKKAYESNSRP